MTTPTVPYQTAKLKLDVDPFDTTTIFPQDPNWQKVDTAAGVRYITSTTSIPTADLYTGMIVVETDTGKSWWYEYSSSSGWIKHYINYPWAYAAYYQGNAPVNVNWGWNTLVPGDCVNATKANDSQSGTDFIKAPVKGIYSGTLHNRIDGLFSGHRSLGLLVNGTSQLEAEVHEWWIPNYSTQVQTNIDRLMLNAGDLVGMFVGTDAAGGTLLSNVRMHLVRPLS